MTGIDEVQLDKYKQEFCPVHKHVDLGEDVANIAMVYVEHDINPKYKDVVAHVKDKLKFVVEDACLSALFTENDISLQKIVGISGKKKWVALVQLDSTSKDGYLQSQLAKCKSLDYMPQTSMTVKVEKEDNNKRVPFKHHHTGRQLEYAVDVVGTQYSVRTMHMHKSRRKLLWERRHNC